MASALVQLARVLDVVAQHDRLEPEEVLASSNRLKSTRSPGLVPLRLPVPRERMPTFCTT